MNKKSRKVVRTDQKSAAEKEKKIIEDGRRSMKEFDMAWSEFFKSKPQPRNDDEDRKQQEEFCDWYNNVRKQSDTGRTPREMGKRIIELGWDDGGESGYPATRTCPECENFGLDVSAEDVNRYVCKICGSVWQRLKPVNDGTGKMINTPDKLKKLLDFHHDCK